MNTNTCNFEMGTFDWMVVFFITVLIIYFLYHFYKDSKFKRTWWVCEHNVKSIFTVNLEKNDSKFVGNFDVKGVEFRSHKSVWG